MSDVVDLTLLAGQVTEIAREMRLLRLQVDNVASRLSTMDTRVSSLEQSFHELVGEVSRGFGQMQQQISRHEKRFDAMDVGLAAVHSEIGESTRKIIEELRQNGR